MQTKMCAHSSTVITQGSTKEKQVTTQMSGEEKDDLYPEETGTTQLCLVDVILGDIVDANSEASLFLKIDNLFMTMSLSNLTNKKNVHFKGHGDEFNKIYWI